MSTVGMQNVVRTFLANNHNKQLEQMYGLPAGILVPEMSDEAKRYLILGFLRERLDLINQKLEMKKPPRGRPIKDKVFHIDNARALVLFDFAHTVVASIEKRPKDTSVPAKISVRQMIELGRIVDADGLFPKEMTTVESLEQSVSRGRKALGIGKHWLAPELDKNFTDLISRD
jgi:hypothetical protein